MSIIPGGRKRPLALFNRNGIYRNEKEFIRTSPYGEDAWGAGTGARGARYHKVSTVPPPVAADRDVTMRPALCRCEHFARREPGRRDGGGRSWCTLNLRYGSREGRPC